MVSAAMEMPARRLRPGVGIVGVGAVEFGGGGPSALVGLIG
ncbi:hypothetical protein EDD30_6706 [Couchioplanes caeruleus]|uniref:Uncharacterized protein n=1 Tax=Couchioplanes caeruleus TaxID=56438 RepID=A0A3N1GTV9_9ACTN|nr:hypothetical protein EDD30_6706 [Couchioplanes caeruleus]